MLAGRLRPSAITYDAVTLKSESSCFSSVTFAWYVFGQTKSSDGPNTVAGNVKRGLDGAYSDGNGPTPPGRLRYGSDRVKTVGIDWRTVNGWLSAVVF